MKIKKELIKLGERCRQLGACALTPHVLHLVVLSQLAAPMIRSFAYNGISLLDTERVEAGEAVVATDVSERRCISVFYFSFTVIEQYRTVSRIRTPIRVSKVYLIEFVIGLGNTYARSLFFFRALSNSVLSIQTIRSMRQHRP